MSANRRRHSAEFKLQVAVEAPQARKPSINWPASIGYIRTRSVSGNANCLIREPASLLGTADHPIMSRRL